MRTQLVIREDSLVGNAKPIEYYIDSDGCWICISHALNTSGYPTIKRNQKNTRVHRYVYELLAKKITEGAYLLHRCDKRPCINPDCMFEGTHQENMIDRDIKGRGGSTKLSREQVEEIRVLWSEGFSYQKDIAVLHGVSQETISRVVNRETWRHVE